MTEQQDKARKELKAKQFEVLKAMPAPLKQFVIDTAKKHYMAMIRDFATAGLVMEAFAPLIDDHAELRKELPPVTADELLTCLRLMIMLLEDAIKITGSKDFSKMSGKLNERVAQRKAAQDAIRGGSEPLQ